MIKARRLVKSFGYAFRGLGRVLREEQNLKIQLAMAAGAAVLGFFFRINRYEWGFLLFAIVLVILAETINSAIERTTDILKPRIHDYVKEIKDIMAAAVMLASLLSLAIGLLVFWPYIFQYWQ